MEFGDLLLHISQAVLEVTCVEKQSILIAHGVSPGDVFLTVNDKSVDTIETFRETVRKSEALRIKVASLHEAPITEAYLAKVRNAIHARMRHETRLKAQELFHAVHKEEFAQVCCFSHTSMNEVHSAPTNKCGARVCSIAAARTASRHFQNGVPCPRS